MRIHNDQTFLETMLFDKKCKNLISFCKFWAQKRVTARRWSKSNTLRMRTSWWWKLFKIVTNLRTCCHWMITRECSKTIPTLTITICLRRNLFFTTWSLCGSRWPTPKQVGSLFPSNAICLIGCCCWLLGQRVCCFWRACLYVACLSWLLLSIVSNLVHASKYPWERSTSSKPMQRKHATHHNFVSLFMFLLLFCCFGRSVTQNKQTQRKMDSFLFSLTIGWCFEFLQLCFCWVKSFLASKHPQNWPKMFFFLPKKQVLHQVRISCEQTRICWHSSSRQHNVRIFLCVKAKENGVFHRCFCWYLHFFRLWVDWVKSCLGTENILTFFFFFLFSFTQKSIVTNFCFEFLLFVFVVNQPLFVCTVHKNNNLFSFSFSVFFFFFHACLCEGEISWMCFFVFFFLVSCFCSTFEKSDINSTFIGGGAISFWNQQQFMVLGHGQWQPKGHSERTNDKVWTTKTKTTKQISSGCATPHETVGPFLHRASTASIWGGSSPGVDSTSSKSTLRFSCLHKLSW